MQINVRLYRPVSLVAVGAVAAESLLAHPEHRKPPHAHEEERLEPRPVANLAIEWQSSDVARVGERDASNTDYRGRTSRTWGPQYSRSKFCRLWLPRDNPSASYGTTQIVRRTERRPDGTGVAIQPMPVPRTSRTRTPARLQLPKTAGMRQPMRLRNCKARNLLFTVMSIDHSHRTMRRFLLCSLLLSTAAPAAATQYVDIGLHGRVQASDIVVVARVVDPALALVSVERVLKGDAQKQITLVAYVDGFAVPAQRKLLVANAHELMFLTKKGDAYAPVQDQYGRMTVNGDQLVDSFRAQPRNMSQTIASIQRLVALQARVARSDAEADAAYVAALRSSDIESLMWALWNAKDRIKVPSPALVDALLASWPTAKEVGPVLGSWNAAGLVANTVVAWRLQRAAPFFAKVLTTSPSGDERAWAAMALGGSGDRAYLPVLRQVAAEDAHAQARALAYNGIMYMLGPDSLGELRLGAKDTDAQVRARAVVDAYNLLEFGHPVPRWPPPSNALIAEVRAFLTEMQRDPAGLVSDNAKSMLAMIVRHRP